LQAARAFLFWGELLIKRLAHPAYIKVQRPKKANAGTFVIAFRVNKSCHANNCCRRGNEFSREFYQQLNAVNSPLQKQQHSQSDPLNRLKFYGKWEMRGVKGGAVILNFAALG